MQNLFEIKIITRTVLEGSYSQFIIEQIELFEIL